MSRRRKKQKKDDTDSGDEESGQDGGGDDSESSEDSSDESSEDSDSSEDSQDTEESEDAGKADVHGPPSSSSALAKFYGETKRIDTIDVSCVLHPETIKFYFKRMYVFVRHWPSLICYFRLGDGKLLKEGAEKLRDKYYLSPRQFHRLAPPSVEGTKLHFLNNLEFGGLTEKLHHIHRWRSMGLDK